MSEDVISIRPADLSYIEGSLSNLNRDLITTNQNVLVVDELVTKLDHKHNVLAIELKKLAKSFDDYVGEYRRKTELQFAQTEIIEIKQKLQIAFGHYADIRRKATGILQAVDKRLV